MNMLWFVRMAKWARHPPSMKMVKIVGLVLLIAVAIWGLDQLGLWPDWARTGRGPKIPHLN